MMESYVSEMDYSKLPLKYKLMTKEQAAEGLQKLLKDKKKKPPKSQKTVIETLSGRFYL